MIESIPEALGVLASFDVLLLIVAGTTVGMTAALLPGIGGSTALAILIALTFTMPPTHAFPFLVAVMGGTGFAGSITSILLNLPGEGVNAATTLDGYPMARSGRAGEAIGASAAASALGALFGVLVLVAAIPVVRPLLLAVGPAEVFALSVAGIALISSVSRGKMIPGLISGAAGLLISTVGLNTAVGTPRFDYGSRFLFDGFPLVPVIIGLFAVPELLKLIARKESISVTPPETSRGAWKGVKAVLQRPATLLRGSAIGVGIGVLPGVGAAISTWVAYFVEKNTSSDPSRFGHGAIEGVIAPEASNDSKEGASLIPLFALGIPGSISTAILMGAFAIHGIPSGRQMLEQENIGLVWMMIFALILSNILVSSLGLVAARPLVRLTALPVAIIAPIILLLSLSGPYATTRTFYGVLVTVAFGLLGIVMVATGYPRPPFVIGFILLPIAERNFLVATQVHRGSFGFLLDPAVLSILIVAVLPMVVLPLVRRRRAQRGDARNRESLPAGAAEGGTGNLPPGSPPAPDAERSALPDDPEAAYSNRGAEFVWLGLLGLWALWFGAETFRMGADAALFPRLTVVVLLVLLVARLGGAWRARASGQLEAGDGAGAFPLRGIVYACLWLVALPVAFLALGILVGGAVYAFVFYMAHRGRPRVATALRGVALGAGCWLGLYSVFERGLNIRLPTGWFF